MRTFVTSEIETFLRALDLNLDRPFTMIVIGVADAPYDYETRLLPLDLGGFKRLKILVPEKHDLALMKIVRGYENDLAAVAEIHKQMGLTLDTLVSRYVQEMTHVVGDRMVVRQNFLAAVERVFGEKAARKLETKV